jgi:hypothetical protein
MRVDEFERAIVIGFLRAAAVRRRQRERKYRG